MSFNFIAKEPQWSFYGEGLGSYVTDIDRNINNKEKGSLWLSTDWGETQTAFFEWNDLTPGLYKVMAYVRAKDVQIGTEGASFWHFYDSGLGTQSVFLDLHGSFDWRKVEYTINVKAHDLTIWFRLKSIGQVWVDDFSLEKIETVQKVISIDSFSPLPLTKISAKAINSSNTKERKKLYSINEPLEFSAHEFLNFKPEVMNGFDRLEIQVFNPENAYVEFFVTLADDKTTNYWSQTNYKQSLAPGWNNLSFSLLQYVGERGAHRFQRSINLSKVKKFFIIVDPDKKNNRLKSKFLISNITISSHPFPSIPEGVTVFDFTSQHATDQSNYTKVTSQDLITKDRNYGLESPKFWRIEDSQYASTAHRYSIGLTEGHFKVKVPNGTYQISLVINKLGFWDVPFWSVRNVFLNKKNIFKEKRESAHEFLKDLLMFESTVPDITDHPYDLYLKKIFNTIDATVEVKNGLIDFEFVADQTGISLNSLIIWNKQNQSNGLSYIASFNEQNKNEFDWMSRSIQKKNTNITKKISINAVESSLFLNPVNPAKTISQPLQFIGGTKERPYKVIEIASGNSKEKVSWSFDDFTDDKGLKINKRNLLVSDIIYQYTSPDTNHETYLITGKYLKPLIEQSIILKKNQNRYLWLQISFNDKIPKGVFRGKIIFKYGSNKTEFPITIYNLSYTLTKIDFPVGFFGLDPLPYSYFPKDEYSDLRKYYRHLALSKLGESGFTTFTGLPEKIDEINDLFKESAKFGIKTVFSYGGQFPQKILDLSNTREKLGEDEKYKKVAITLKPLLESKGWPKIIHTFSDEAGGYSDHIAADILLAKKYKQYLPFMSLGGFGSFQDEDSKKLNRFFDFGFYSQLSILDIKNMRNNKQEWGLYNASAGNLDDPRFSFGLGLYIARLNGLSQYLEWHTAAINNYPYYDFDGRESDSVMFYPTSNGKLLHSLRFELATEGLHAFQKLRILEKAIANDKISSPAISAAKNWLDSLTSKFNFYSTVTFLNNKKINFIEFESKLNEHLLNVFLK